ncbi:hypothetical protein GWI33_012894 [Rhynchophorus ferrugineus]|uniref:Uncharacterized protein n=1 Tax=Rhynchophorus ferrugineus TaxID=354439 RepID=A0A834M751_RHYFE|nr:hypothetical protein GWI33_012894 [Rhynchophorus ferrugineus]
MRRPDSVGNPCPVIVMVIGCSQLGFVLSMAPLSLLPSADDRARLSLPSPLDDHDLDPSNPPSTPKNCRLWRPRINSGSLAREIMRSEKRLRPSIRMRFFLARP